MSMLYKAKANGPLRIRISCGIKEFGKYLQLQELDFCCLFPHTRQKWACIGGLSTAEIFHYARKKICTFSCKFTIRV
ncbi:hypothetical protein CsSME_00038370 [Camellia sinensis var. sinensis]